MLRVGVIADTHIQDARGTIPAEVLAAFEALDCILHAGDLTCRAVLDRLRALAPVHAVQGNVDSPELAARLPESLELDLDGAIVGLTHGHLGRAATTPLRALERFRATRGLRAVIFGHSHEPCNELRGELLLFNPGSPTQPRRHPRPSFGLLEIEDGVVRGRHIYLDRR